MGPGSSGTPARCRRAVSTVETVLALAIACVVFYAVLTLLGSGRKMEAVMGAPLGLSAEAHRALTQFLRDLQEGIAVVQPPPGHTLPHAVVRDKINRLAFYALVSGPVAGEYHLRRSVASSTGTTTSTMMTGVRRVTFTALSDGALLVHMTLGLGSHRFAFHTQVRLRNRDAAEPE